jgi:hypothetical protein
MQSVHAKTLCMHVLALYTLCVIYSFAFFDLQIIINKIFNNNLFLCFSCNVPQARTLQMVPQLRKYVMRRSDTRLTRAFRFTTYTVSFLSLSALHAQLQGERDHYSSFRFFSLRFLLSSLSCHVYMCIEREERYIDVRRQRQKPVFSFFQFSFFALCKRHTFVFFSLLNFVQ